MNPKIWGPVFWQMLIYVVQAYPEQPSETEKTNMFKFFESLGSALPCKICQSNYQKHFDLTMTDLETAKSLLDWLYQLNVKVNQNSTLNLEEFVNKYTKHQPAPNTNKKRPKTNNNYPFSRYRPAKRRFS